MPNFLWSFSSDNSGLGGSTAQTSIRMPKLVAPGDSGTSTARTQINVVKDFYWTYSKLNEGRQEVPRIILTERKLRTNALVSQLKYSLGQAGNGISQTIDTLNTFASDFGYTNGFSNLIKQQ